MKIFVPGFLTYGYDLAEGTCGALVTLVSDTINYTQNPIATSDANAVGFEMEHTDGNLWMITC